MRTAKERKILWPWQDSTGALAAVHTIELPAQVSIVTMPSVCNHRLPRLCQPGSK